MKAVRACFAEESREPAEDDRAEDRPQPPEFADTVRADCRDRFAEISLSFAR